MSSNTKEKIMFCIYCASDGGFSESYKNKKAEHICSAFVHSQGFEPWTH